MLASVREHYARGGFSKDNTLLKEEGNLLKDGGGGTIRLARNSTSFPLQLFEVLKEAKFGKEYDYLKYYQNLVRHYFNEVDIGSRGLLIMHMMGLGKSILAVSLALDQLKERRVIILLAKSLEENMRKSIHKCVRLRAKYEPTYFLALMSERDLDKWIDANFSFVSMNASNMLKQLERANEGSAGREYDKMLESKLEEINSIGNLNGKFVIVDEAHNLFRAITNGSANAIGFYNLVMASRDVRLAFLTGTPIASDPFEIVPMFNMLAGGELLPTAYKDFYNLFVNGSALKNKHILQNRLVGLISYVDHESKPGSGFGREVDDKNKVEFPEMKEPIIRHINMESVQWMQYQLARDIEMEENKVSVKGKSERDFIPSALNKPKSIGASTYRVRSRILGNCYITEGGVIHSPKFEQVIKDSREHNTRTGLIYSQFAGEVLEPLAKFLIQNGFKQLSATDLRFDSSLHSSLPSSPPPSEEEKKDEKEGGRREKREDWEDWAGSTKDMFLRRTDAFERYMEHMNRALTYSGGDEDKKSKKDNKIISFSFLQDGDEVRRLFVKFPNYKHSSDNNTFPRYVILAKDEDGDIVGYALVEYTSRDYNNGRVIASEGDSILSHLSECVGNPAKLRSIVMGGQEDVTIKTDGISHKKIPDRQKRFILYTGETSMEDRKLIEHVFNSDDNRNGGIIDMILTSSVGAEGLDLKNLGYIIALEPYWTNIRFLQLAFRGKRADSHIKMKPEEKNVQMYIYLAVPPLTEKKADGSYVQTTDVELYKKSSDESVLIEEFGRCLQEVAIECNANAGKNCLMCSPTDEKLFTNDIFIDVLKSNPCRILSLQSTSVDVIEYGGQKYYYKKSPDALYDYKIFIYDEKINAYVKMKDSDFRIEGIVEEIKRLQSGESKFVTAQQGEGKEEGEAENRDNNIIKQMIKENRVLIFAKDSCPFCKKAKALLDNEKIKYKEYKIAAPDDKVLEQLIEFTGMKTVPQIFINGKLLGGFAELDAAHSMGELRRMLQS